MVVCVEVIEELADGSRFQLNSVNGLCEERPSGTSGAERYLKARALVKERRGERVLLRAQFIMADGQ